MKHIIKRKSVRIILISILLVLGVAAIGYILILDMAYYIEAEYDNMKPLDLDMISDGSYTGSFDKLLVAVDLEVRVENHRITDIIINDQRCGPGYDAREVPDRMIETQSTLVDAVSGATASSKAIMISTYRALRESTAKK